LVSEAAECLEKAQELGRATTASGLTKAIVEAVKSCATRALEAVGDSVKEGVSEVVGIATAVPDTVRFLHQLGQMIGMGFTDVIHNGGIYRLDVTYQGPPATSGSSTEGSVPLPEEGEAGFAGANIPDAVFPPTKISSGPPAVNPRSIDPCGATPFPSSWLSTKDAWQGDYHLGDGLGSPYTVRLYPVTNPAALIRYLDAVPSSCDFGGVHFTRRPERFGEAGGLWSGTANGRDTTGIYAIYAKNYLIYIIDNASPTTSKKINSDQALRKNAALTYVLQKADRVLRLGPALEHHN
jgi:hypothetical protein